MTLDRSARRAIARYLASIRRARRGSPREETRDIIAGIREHIEEGLRQLGRETVDAAAVQTVIDGMSPASSFGIAPEAIEADRARTARFAYAGLIAMGAAVAVTLVTLIVLAIVKPAGSTAFTIALLVSGALLLAAICLGAVGFRHPAGKTALFGSIAILLLVTSLLTITSRKTETTGPQPQVELSEAPVTGA
jgi:hypothetical protein